MQSLDGIFDTSKAIATNNNNHCVVVLVFDWSSNHHNSIDNSFSHQFRFNWQISKTLYELLVLFIVQR